MPAAKATKAPKKSKTFRVILEIECIAVGHTIEEVKQNLDNALDYSKLRTRNVQVIVDECSIHEVRTR